MLYAAARKEINPRKTTESPQLFKELMKIKISPNKLGEGGAAILKILNKNHQKQNVGAIEIEPRNSKILRDPVRL